MQTENNAGAKVIGVMALLVAAWGVYNVFKSTGKNEKSLDGTNKRIKGMVENWKKEGRAFSNVQNNDGSFFKKINKKISSVGITSQTGNDVLYYNTNLYNDDNAAIKKRRK